MSNPFDDPAGPVDVDAAAVLTVDRNATLTLATDALIVLDEGLRYRRAATNGCGLLPQLAKNTMAIPFYNVLWAELDDFDVIVRYAHSTGKKSCRVGHVSYTVTDKALHPHAKRWVQLLMDRAYPPGTKRRKNVKVLINPFGGQGNAQKLWTREVEPIFAAANLEVDVEKTAYRGHAVEIAQKLDVDAVDVVACASGDGLPHEVFNGLAKRQDAGRALARIAVTQIPCGTGNAMSLNLNGTDSPSLAALAIVKGVRTPLDLVAITQGNNLFYSFLSQAVGIIAETDLGTESLRWMGSFRLTWGILVRILAQTVYPAEVAVVLESDDKSAIRESYKHAVEEHEAASAKHLLPQDDDRSDTNSVKALLPALRFGTVNDDLPASFHSQDMPTIGNFYVGNMCWMSPDAPFFTAALPSDGRMDLMNISGRIPRLLALRMVTSVDNGMLMNFPEVEYSKVLAYRIKPRVHQPSPQRRLRAKIGRWLGGAGEQKEGLIAIDGERVPFEPFQAEVVPALGMVLSKRGAIYEFYGPKPGCGT